MNADDIKRLLLGPTLFNLDTLIAKRLVPILYAVGLAAILVWAINHLFFMFGSNFGNGLWGLLEIAVFGSLALIILRVACEALLVFFTTHEPTTERVASTRIGTNLLEDVQDAIHDLADADGDRHVTSATTASPRVVGSIPPAPPPPVRPSSDVVASDLPVRGPTVRRTARRTPKPKTPPPV